ncbi:MAG: hypothetical protein AAB415_03020 [Patescibacteria group bacterium]
MKNLLSKFFNKNGLIVTLLLGLIVSVVASRIENLIQKQRYLELLQIEIRTNYLTALRTINATASELSTQTFPYFSTAVYEAGLESGYILTISPLLQSQIMSIYNPFLQETNHFVKQQSMIVEEYNRGWQKCVFEQTLESNDPSSFCAKEKQLKEFADQVITSELKQYISTSVEKELQEISNKFNPTQNRLKSPLLRLLMGTEVLGIQK